MSLIKKKVICTLAKLAVTRTIFTHAKRLQFSPGMSSVS